MKAPIPDHELPEWLQREYDELDQRLARHDHSYLWVDAVIVGGLAGIVVAAIVAFG